MTEQMNGHTTSQENKVELRQLGRTKLKISPIGLGTWQFAGGVKLPGLFWKKIPPDEINGIVRSAWDRGINWFDTAERYGGGKSEQRLAAGLQAAGIDDSDVIIATKWDAAMRRARSIKKTIGDRKRYLDPYNIDLHQIHFPMPLSSRKAQMNAMADLIEAGDIKATGVSNFNEGKLRKAHELLEALGHPLASNQVHYSLLARGMETNGILDAAKELGITIIAYSPLEMGLLTGKFHKDKELFKQLPFMRKRLLGKKRKNSHVLIEVMRSIAQHHGVTCSQVALNWMTRFHGETIVAIPGASRASHVEQNAGAMKFQLSKEEMNHIDELSRKFF